jgi:glycosyltransferase involved in cell wall biosynthesis
MYPRLRTVDQVYDAAAGWIERMDGPTIAAIDAHISCNRHISAALVGRGAAPDVALTVHNAPDLSLFDPAAFDAERRAALAARFGLPSGRRVVAFIGRMHQQKRPMDVVELARQLRGDARLAFLMVGDGPLAETVRAQVATSGLDNISVHAFHQPSSECYAVADVLLLPSEYEGMPMVILEALAMGVPVVATDVGNNREVLTRTGGGRIVDRVGDVPALRQAVLATLDAPADPAALRAAVEREFGMSAMLDAYARILLDDR